MPICSACLNISICEDGYCDSCGFVTRCTSVTSRTENNCKGTLYKAVGEGIVPEMLKMGVSKESILDALAKLECLKRKGVALKGRRKRALIAVACLSSTSALQLSELFTFKTPPHSVFSAVALYEENFGVVKRDWVTYLDSVVAGKSRFKNMLHTSLSSKQYRTYDNFKAVIDNEVKYHEISV